MYEGHVYTNGGRGSLPACMVLSCWCCCSASTPWHQVSASRASAWESRRRCRTRGHAVSFHASGGNFTAEAPGLSASPPSLLPRSLVLLLVFLLSIFLLSVHHAGSIPSQYEVIQDVCVCSTRAPQCTHSHAHHAVDIIIIAV